MTKRKQILACAFGLAFTVASYKGVMYAYAKKTSPEYLAEKAKEKKEENARYIAEKKKERMVMITFERFKEKCDGTDPECFYTGNAEKGRRHEERGNFCAAGQVYANVMGKQKDALEMADMCEKKGKEKAAKAVRDAVEVRQTAIERFYAKE